MLTGVFGACQSELKLEPRRLIEELDRNGVAKAIISTSARPRVVQFDDRADPRAGPCVQPYGARMVLDYPKRFAQFGFLPTPDVEATLQEIEYVLVRQRRPASA